jgi:threonine/homoserine efflux transporter RhtA
MWTLYWWFKRQRRLDTLANVVRAVAITSGVALMYLEIRLFPVYTLQGMRFIVLPTAALIVVFLFFPDASYFAAQGLRKLFDRP